MFLAPKIFLGRTPKFSDLIGQFQPDFDHVAHPRWDSVPPKKFLSWKLKILQKNVQISARFPTTFDFDPEYLRNGSTYRTSEKKLHQRNPFHVGQKKFGELLSTNKKVLEVPTEPCTQVDIFRETTFRPLGGAAPSNFLHVRDWARLYSALHTTTGRVSPKKYLQKFKIWPSVCATIISWLVGFHSRNFSRPRRPTAREGW